MIRLFAYGTLMRGEANAGVLVGRFVGAASTAAAYTLVDLGAYPGLLAGGTTAVAGELWEVDGEAIERLDAFEEHPRVYLRGPVRLADGEGATAYLLRPERAAGARPIPGGDWRAHRRSR